MILLTGAIGAFVVLLAFIANTFGIIDRRSFTYTIANVYGSVLLAIYAYLLNSWPFVVLNSIWAFVAFVEIFITLAHRLKNR